MKNLEWHMEILCLGHKQELNKKIWTSLNKSEDEKNMGTDIRSGGTGWGGACYNKAITYFLSCLKLGQNFCHQHFLLNWGQMIQNRAVSYSCTLLLFLPEINTFPWNFIQIHIWVFKYSSNTQLILPTRGIFFPEIIVIIQLNGIHLH